MTTEHSHDRCACGEDHAPKYPALDAFFSAVVDRIGRFPLDDSEARGTFIAGAIQGRVMREHVNEAHPSEVEHVAGIACPTNDTREGWLFGYRYEDPTPPRGGDDTDTAEHSGDARGGGGDGAGADRDGQGAPGYGVDAEPEPWGRP